MSNQYKSDPNSISPCVKGLAKLNAKQRKFVQARARGKTAKEAAIAAGYSPGTAPALERNPDIQQVFRDLIRRAITPGRLVQLIKEGLEAENTEYFKHEGHVTDQRKHKAWSERRAYLELGRKLQSLSAFNQAIPSGGKPAKSADNQQGVNCAIFRNESPTLSSTLILEAETIAHAHFGPQRLYTYVNPRAIRSANPGFCFLKAGWSKCGITKWNKLLILQKLLPTEK